MADVASLSVVISADIADLRKNLNKVQANLRKAFGGDTLQQSKSMATGLGVITAAFGALGGASIKAAADMEQTRMAFTTLLKSGQKADAFLREMEKFAKSTPFDMPGVLNAAKQLIAFGFQAKEVKPMLTSLGDASAALGLGDAGIQRLTLALGQMNAAGKVTTQDMKQLVSAGVPAFKYLAEQAGVSIAEIQSMISKGAVDSTTGIKAIMAGMNAEYGGMMANQEKTLLGMWANISESLSFTLREIGDQLVETFDLHSKLESAKVELETFSNTLKSSGMAAAIKAVVPPEAISAVYAFSGALVMAAVPGLTSTAAAAIRANAALIPLMAKGMAVGLAFQYLTDNGMDAENAILLLTGAIAVLHADSLTNLVLMLAKSNTGLRLFIAEVQLASGVSGKFSAALGVIKTGLIAVKTAALAALGPLALLATALAIASAAWEKYKHAQAGGQFEYDELGNVTIKDRPDESAAALDLMNESARKAQQRRAANVVESDQAKAAPPSVTSGGGGSGGTDKIAREIDRINEKLVEMKKNTEQARFEFENFKMNQLLGDLEGGAAVYGQIFKNAVDGINTLKNEVTKLSETENEARQLYDRAVLAGNATQIASTKATLDQITQARIEAAQYAADRELAIKEKSTADMLKFSTAQSAIQADLDAAYREADFAAYQTALSNKNVAFLTAMTEQQAMMQQFYDWRMEAESTFLSFQLQAMETLKNGFASAFANAITEGENLGKAIQNLGKQIINMFIQWQVKRMAASIFSKAMMAKDTAAQSAQIASLMPAASALAWNVLVYNPGAGGLATSLQSAGMAAGAAMGQASGIAGSIGTKDSNWGMNGTYKLPGFANGGIITRPTVGLIGEKPNNPEGVFPLKKLDQYLGGGSGASVELNIYGDINSNRDFDDTLDKFNDAIYGAIRSG